jgi:hypothetical protein
VTRRHWPRWTPEEDAIVLARGGDAALALDLDRTPKAVRMRHFALVQSQRREAWLVRTPSPKNWWPRDLLRLDALLGHRLSIAAMAAMLRRDAAAIAEGLRLIGGGA